MTWNHRVVRREYPDADPTERVSFGIHEVYYDEDGKPDKITTDTMDAWGENLAGLKENLQRMLRACDYPVLEYADFDTNTKEEIPT